MFSDLDNRKAIRIPQSMIREAAMPDHQHPKPVPVKSTKIEVTVFFCECGNCFKKSEFAFDKVAALMRAQHEDWLCNGEEVRCPDCLAKLAEEVP
jgi:hypothetical protein